MNLFSRSVILSYVIFFVLGCKQINVYEKSTPIPKHQWKSNYPCKGTFSITDTASYYNIYLVLRHTDAYKYNNVWLNVGLQAPGDSMYFQKVNFGLSSEATGWYGSGMDDIWEVRNLLTDHPKKFKKSGVYQFSLYHIMRDEPLKNIMSAGLRVEKVEKG